MGLLLIGLICFIVGKAAEMEDRSFIVWAFIALLMCIGSTGLIAGVFGIPFGGPVLGAILSFSLLGATKAIQNR